ncbi:Global nitrogen regulator [subsurface metagenome]
MSNLWYIENTNLFSIFCPHKFGEFRKDHQLREYRKGDFIYFPEDTSSNIFLIAEGKVKLLYYTEDGEEVAKSILTKGEVFGELALLGEEKRKDYAQSIQDNTMICQVQLDQMRGLMKEDASFALKINKIIGLRIRKLERKLESLVYKDVRTRILEFLGDFAIEKGEKEGYSYRVLHSLTHKDMADLVGTTRQTVTTIMNELRNEGLINFSRKKIYISDIRKLDMKGRDLLQPAL